MTQEKKERKVQIESVDQTEGEKARELTSKVTEKKTFFPVHCCLLLLFPLRLLKHNKKTLFVFTKHVNSGRPKSRFAESANTEIPTKNLPKQLNRNGRNSYKGNYAKYL